MLDSNPILVSITGVLRMAGYRVFQAYDGQAAEEFCCTLDDIALLILNTHVDGMNGLDLMDRVRTHGPDLPILHIDTHRDTAIPQDVPTLTEPFTPAELLAAVAEMLAARKERESQNGVLSRSAIRRQAEPNGGGCPVR